MKQIQSIFNRLALPTLVRAIVTGFLVSTIGIAIWSADIAFFKLSPISIVLMVVPLMLYWKYFSGAGWPQRTSVLRRDLFRLTRLSKRVWLWGIAAALLFVVIVQSSFVVTFRLIDFPDAFTSQYKIIESLPGWVAWLALFMSSLVAGVCEEAGFRGYMQVPLERRFGPATGIVIVSLVFLLIHLDRSWAAPILPHIFFASVLLGLLAYKTNSLIPGIVGHTILDTFNYSFWWTNIMGKFARKTILVTGIDTHFAVWSLILLATTLGFFWAIHKLK